MGVVGSVGLTGLGQTMSISLTAFIHDLGADDLPAGVVGQVRNCLLDLVGVAAGGSETQLSRIVREHACNNLGGVGRRSARLLFDGRAVSPVGAAFANAATIDAMDGHDGHRLTKGHAGAEVLPAALCLINHTTAAVGDLVTALVVGYEVANRAGMALHSVATDYHSSGAWNALGAAAVAARLLDLDQDATAHALGIAEYQAPRAPMMRCIDHPTMVKDSSAWGAQAGVSAALLAADGFTGAPASLLTVQTDADGLWGDLGRRWTILEQYFKPYPVCRWAQPAVQATIGLVDAYDVAPEDIESIEVATFHEATRLSTRVPTSTEQAQYSLPFPVAAAAVQRRLDPHVVAYPDQVDEQVRRLAATLRLEESADMTAAFPARRGAKVSLVLANGSRLSSGPTEAPGDPEAGLTRSQLEEKFLRSVAGPMGESRAYRLLGLLRGAEGCGIAELLDEMYTPVGA